MNLQPLEDRIVVRPAEAEETTVSGLVIPDTAKEKPQQGEVLAVGPGRRAENTRRDRSRSTSRSATRSSTRSTAAPRSPFDGEDLLILNARDVLAKVGSGEQVQEVVSGAPAQPRSRRGTASRAVSRRVRTRGRPARAFRPSGRRRRRSAWPTCSRPCRSGARSTSGDDDVVARVLEARQALERRARSRRADASTPGASGTTAVTASPKRSSGTPTTRQSATAGCRFTASSTSSG